MKNIICSIFVFSVALVAYSAPPPDRSSGPTFRPAEPMKYTFPSVPSIQGIEEVRAKWERPDVIQILNKIKFDELQDSSNTAKKNPNNQR